MTEKIAIVAPGQGSQSVGMGAELFEQNPAARAVYQQADRILGFPLTDICFQGPDQRLNDTLNTQPAIYTSTIALWRALEDKLNGTREHISLAAGHSLGEFAALTIAGALPFEEGLRLVRRRGEAMRDAGEDAPGGMAAVIGLDAQDLEQVLAKVRGQNGGEGVWLANDNCPGQVVIAGQREALDKAMALAEAAGAYRVIPLKVSVPCHTPYMAPAAEALAEALEEAVFEEPWIPVVSNVTATPLSDPRRIKDALLRQLSSPVRWVESVECMLSHGVGGMLEIGTRPVVSSLIKRIYRRAKLASITDVETLESFDPQGWLA